MAAMASQLVRFSPGGELARPAPRVDFEQAARAVINAKRSKHTRDAYSRDLAGWISFCEVAAIDPSRATIDDATKFRDDLTGADDSRRRRLATLSSIYKTLHRAGGVVIGNPFHPGILAWPVAGTVLKAHRIDEDQGSRIVAAAAEHSRDHAVLCLLYDTGWRRSAVAMIRRANYRNGRVFGRGKGGKELEVELPPSSVAAIDRWLSEVRVSDYLFPARDGEGHLHPGTVNKIVDHWARVIDPAAHPHSFRALFIRTGLDAGIPQHEVQGAAGHSSPEMTARYDGKARGGGVAKQVALFRNRGRAK
jgi:integrase/recombinase XerD